MVVSSLILAQIAFQAFELRNGLRALCKLKCCDDATHAALGPLSLSAEFPLTPPLPFHILSLKSTQFHKPCKVLIITGDT